MTAFSSTSDWALVFAASIVIGGDENPEKNLRRKDIYLGGGAAFRGRVGYGLERGGYWSFIQRAGTVGYAAGGSYDTGEAMCSRNGITVCGFVNAWTERVHPLPAAISPCKFPRHCQSRPGSIFVLGPTVTSQIPYILQDPHGLSLYLGSIDVRRKQAELSFPLRPFQRQCYPARARGFLTTFPDP